MRDLLTPLLARAQTWCDQAHAAGWLDEADVARLAAVERRTPADLFVDQQMRPLVVALFGGTGVGKSSLLNRLAGTPLARVGVERPTSREVTVYVHESVKLANLPPELPVDATQVRRHDSDAHRNVLWIDAPDINSTEQANRQRAMAWLPHVDLVCYVVSPERYRDDVGWRVLCERGHQHGWMFVLNRWDEGDPAQLQDFERMLRDAGFRDPLLLPTCCVSGRLLPSVDQFAQIQARLVELLQAHGVQELARLGYRARLLELRAALEHAQQHLGDDAVWGRLTNFCAKTWQSAATTIVAGAEWSMRAVAGRFAAGSQSLWDQLRRALAPPRGAASAAGGTETTATDIVVLDQLTGQLWDDWSQGKLQAGLDALEVSARQALLAAAPMRRELETVAESAGTLVAESLRDHVREALARPGSALTRTLRRVMGFLMAFLPCVALVWVAYAVLRNYHAAVQGSAPFLGAAFVIHSVLVVAIAWGVPFTLDRALRPALERTVLRALRAGMQAGLARLGTELERALGEAAAEARSYRQHAAAILSEVAETLDRPIPAPAPAVARVTMELASPVS